MRINSLNSILPGIFKPSSYCEISRIWSNGDKIRVEFPKKLTTVSLPGEPETVAFMEGPIVMAGLVDEERLLYGNAQQPEFLLVPDRERNHSWWYPGYFRTTGQER